MSAGHTPRRRRPDRTRPRKKNSSQTAGVTAMTSQTSQSGRRRAVEQEQLLEGAHQRLRRRQQPDEHAGGDGPRRANR